MSRDTGSDDEIAKALLLENVTGVFGLINDTIGCEKGNGAKSVPSSTSPHHHPNIVGRKKKEERTHY